MKKDSIFNPDLHEELRKGLEAVGRIKAPNVRHAIAYKCTNSGKIKMMPRTFATYDEAFAEARTLNTQWQIIDIHLRTIDE